MNIDKDNFHLNEGITKPFLSLEEQMSLLESRGLIINDHELAIGILNRTNYYRLSAYSLSKRHNDIFDGGTTFEDIYDIYCFDDALRNIIMKYSQLTEISLRAYIAYEHSRIHGPIGYMDSNTFNNERYHAVFIEKLKDDLSNSDDVFVAHYVNDCNCVFPLWVAIESITFGTLSKLFKNLKNQDKNLIADKYYGVSWEYVENWFQVAVVARNISAHGGRFYGRYLRSVTVKLPRKLKSIFRPDSVFAYIYAIHHLLSTSSDAISFRSDIKNILSEHPMADIQQLGFPENWELLLSENMNTKASVTEL